MKVRFEQAIDPIIDASSFGAISTCKYINVMPLGAKSMNHFMASPFVSTDKMRRI
jgi:hypothetical protein